MDAELITDEKLYCLPVPARWFWICLLSIGCRNKGDPFEVSIAYLSKISDIGPTDCQKYLGEFQDSLMITVSKEVPDRIRTDPAGSDRIRATNGTNGTNGTLSSYEDREGSEAEPHPDANKPEIIKTKKIQIPYAQFLNTWNEHRGTLPSIQKLSEGRKAKIRIRLKEQPDLGYWAGLVKKMAASDFCCSGKWATMDWVITNDSNHLKVAEGKYDNEATETGADSWLKKQLAKEGKQ